MLKLSAETFLLNWNTLLVSGFVAASFSPHLRGWLFLWLALAAEFFFLCILPHGKADIIFSFSRHHWCWRFRKQVSVIWVPADFYKHLIQNTHKWKHYFCKTKVKSPKLKTYDSYQRFKVSQDCSSRLWVQKNKKAFWSRSLSFSGHLPIAPLWGESKDKGKITYQSFPIDFGIKIYLVFPAFTVVWFSIQPALSQVANGALFILL